ncbi:MAG: PepSY domain-containing protein, partial [Phenylobacterium sp.]|uniref:PepSY-associated TM helix domain-containing protein n=1 Tax=Phenylobacterium sp. TaxID=1871053 RepID=UPI001A56347C
PAELAGIIALSEARFGTGTISSIVFASPDAAWSEVRLADGHHAWVDHRAGVVREFTQADWAIEWVFDLHHQLLSGDTGELVVGGVGLATALMAVSGLILWWPARRSFTAAVVPKRKGRAGWLAAHRDLAVMAAPMVFVSTLTGATMALPDLSRPLFQAPAPKGPKVAVAASGATNWPAALAQAQARFPGAVVRMAIPARKPGQAASFRMRQAGEWHTNGRTTVFFDPADGRIVSAYDAMAQNTGARVYNSAWPVHTARYGGPVWKALIIVGGLSLAALALYGGEAYRRKLFPARRPPIGG